ncbi:TraB/GumN family protein [Pyxidicoccus parkwayensis]|uniref:TraB/GumN family protein n=1 Tax=Pyxidicoccus parkwayensis TaxID=2813578 RepID=A0ABX7NYP8_9BACT|nr:TraB/GumN family protein [Pyxidicoccus parkwaysis]QSQ21203.1 TraB/GumN family protein [Pyxidicoccus parkwaysis]
MKRLSLLPSLLLTALLGVGCASTPAPRPYVPVDTGHAFLWEVKDGHGRGGTAYLVGSIHMGKTGELALPPSMEAAFAKSDALVVEVDVDKVDPTAMQKLALELGRLPDGQRLSQRLDPVTMRLLGNAAQRMGLPLSNLEPLRPWLVGMVLSVTELQQAGYQQGEGIDRAFLARAHDAGKSIVELETAEGQLRMLAGTPDSLQDLMLRDQLRRDTNAGAALDQVISAWKAGDADGLASLVLEGADDATYRPVYERIYFERNTQMATRVDALLAEPRTHFIVVGAGHVVGPKGLVALLQQQGHTVRQLSRDAAE